MFIFIHFHNAIIIRIRIKKIGKCNWGRSTIGSCGWLQISRLGVRVPSSSKFFSLLIWLNNYHNCFISQSHYNPKDKREFLNCHYKKNIVITILFLFVKGILLFLKLFFLFPFQIKTFNIIVFLFKWLFLFFSIYFFSIFFFSLNLIE